MGGAALEGLVDDPEDAVALFEAGTRRLARAVPPPPRRRPDGRRRHAEHVDVRARGPRDRAPHALLAQRGARQGAALRRLLARGADPAALDARRARPAAAGRRTRGRADGGRVDVTGILTQMLQMGDEAHNRNRAGTLMLLRDLSPAMVGSAATPVRQRDVAEALRFVGGNDHFFLNLAMPACKLALDAARGIEGSTMVVAMARNGTDFGIQVAGTGDEWFTGPAQLADGPVPRRLRPRRRQPRHRRLGDHRDRRHRRLRDGDRPGDRAARRRLGARRPGHHPADARDHARREPALVGAGPGVPGRARPASTSPGSAGPASCPRSTPAWPASTAGVGQVGAGLVTPPAEIFPAALARLASLTRTRSE